MKICVSAQGDNLDCQVDPRFGRCRYFIFVDSDSMEFEAVDNSNAASAGGAGIRSAQLVADKGVQALLSGNVGPNAFQALQAAGIKVITGLTGTIKEAVEKFKTGEYKETTDPSVGSKFGMGGS